MLESKVKILDELNQFVSLVMNEQEVLKAYTNDASDFSRRRKLPFDMLVLFITKLCKKTLSIELENFFSSLGMEDPCTGSAFTQQRKKLKASFFQSWNELLLLSHSYHCANEIKRWKGYRIIAVDGSNISLINTPKFREYFGGQSNQRGFFVQAKTLYCCDVLNELIINAQIAPYRTGELTLAYPLVKAFEKDNLLIYDRNFFNYKMMALHLWSKPESKFIIRAKERNPVVNAFIKSKKKSAVVEFQPSSSAIEGLSKEGLSINKSQKIKVRLIRVELEKSVEILATNLWKEPCAAFKELYSKRWGIETNISLQKNILQLECFSGLTIETIYQDFFATVFMVNLHSVLIKQAQEMLQNSTRKYPVKVNKNKSMGKLRSVFVQLFRNPQIYIIIEQLNLYFTRDPVPIRTGRSYPRVVKNKQSKSKHKTYTNFKLAA
ncbi:MAG: IS4 family transposase [Bacteroidota bacterium]